MILALVIQLLDLVEKITPFFPTVDDLFEIYEVLKIHV